MNMIKKFLCEFDDKVRNIGIHFLKKRFLKLYMRKYTNFFEFPIYLISFNRLSFLKQSVEWLRKYGYTNAKIYARRLD